MGFLLATVLNLGFSSEGNSKDLPNDSIANQKERLLNIGYGVQAAWMITGSVGFVEGQDLQKNFTTNLGNTLYGRLPGLTVTQNPVSAEPGYDFVGLLSRGVGTFGPNRGPLIMVDGYEVNQEIFSQISIQEIETITLLRDASATAIYGIRGANGVLLITTKRGHEGPLQINFSTQVGFQKANRLPEFMGSYDYANLFNEASLNNGIPGPFSQNDLDAYRDGTDPYLYPNVNWYEETMRNVAPISNYNLDFKGGSETVRYFVSLNAINSKGLLEKSGDYNEESINPSYSRFNFRSNLDIKLSQRLTALISLGGSVEDMANPGRRTGGEMFNLLSTIPRHSFPVFNPDGSYGGSSLFRNPVGELRERGSFSSNGRTLVSNLRLNYELDKISPGLSASVAASFNNFFRSYSDKTSDYERFGIRRNDDGELEYTRFGQNVSLVGSEGESDQWKNYSFQAFLNYNRTIGKHGISSVIMYNSEAAQLSGTQNLFPYKILGGAGRFTYTNSKKYIAEISLGYYGTENFAPENRFGFFPSASLGWIASNEGFLKNVSGINFLKFRGSYGQVGNHQIGGQRFMFMQYYGGDGGYNLGQDNRSLGTLVERSPANPRVTWEKDRQMNFGLEAVIFNQIDLSFDVFRNNRFDILTTPFSTTPMFTGFFGSPFLPEINLGEVSNRGFEASVRYFSKPGKGLKYFVGASAWYAQNKIEFMSEVIRPEVYQNRTGHPVGQPFMYEAIGFFRNQADIDNSPQQFFTDVQRPGDLKYRDKNEDGIIDQRDQIAMGNPSYPSLTMTLHSGFQSKGFDLDFLFQGVTGRSVYLPARYVQAFQNDGLVPEIALGRWTPETHETATYPRLSHVNDLNNFQPSSFWQRDGSFIKLRSIELGYTISGTKIQKLNMGNMRFFINGTNMFSIDHVGITDPETLQGYPAFRTVSIGARVQF